MVHSFHKKIVIDVEYDETFQRSRLTPIHLLKSD